jgi:dipeptidyl-peptidase-4
VTRLTQTPADEIDAKVSPNDGYVSFVRDNNLVLMNLPDRRETRLTSDGGGAVTWGLAEFVANEEMFRRFGYWWSPTETYLAAARVDETPVVTAPHVELSAEGPKVVQERYPRAGTPNARVDLFVFDIANATRHQVDLGANADQYIARVDWSVDGRTLYIQRQSRDQKRLDLIAADPATGATRVLLTETSDKWVELTDDFKPLRGGGFIWSSEKSGQRHLYLYDGGGGFVRQLTSGDWAIAKLEGVNETTGEVFFSAAIETPLQRDLYAVDLNKPEKPQRVTGGAGWWSFAFAKSGEAFIGNYSDPTTPPQTGIYAKDGKRLRWIEENRLDANHPLAPFKAELSVPKFGSLKAADGSDLYYGLWLPSHFSPAKKYPVVVIVYGGPYSQEVRSRWGVLTDQLLTAQGYIVFRLDNRGSANRSVAFKTAIYHRLGQVETEDQLAGIRYLKSLPYVDADHIGVMGWSYGGFMALSLMTAPGSPLRAGAAGAAPTDWRLYDTHYAEQFMGTPQSNREGYDAADIVPKLSQLKGDLLLLHGMADDNVTFDNALRVIETLQSESRPFELMVYPGERHLVNEPAKQLQLWKTYLDFFRRRLKAAG